jgi:hypothetical protein
MDDLPHASTLAKKYNSGIAGVSISQRKTMADAIQTLEKALENGADEDDWINVAPWYEFASKEMRDYMKTLGYEMEDGDDDTPRWFMRISPSVKNENLSDIKDNLKPAKRSRT